MSRVRSNRVCFTWNNYNEDGLDDLEKKLQDLEKSGQLQYAIIAREIGESGTPHIQGFVHLNKKHYTPKNCGIKFWKDFLPGGKQMHFETSKGTDEQNFTYCSKDGPYITFGETGSSNSKWSEILQLAKRGREEEIQEEYSEEYIKYHIQISRIIKKSKMEERLDLTLQQLRPWQQRVIDLLNEQNDRQILFVVDEEGGKGKSALCSHLMSQTTTWACQGGKINDLMHTYNKDATIAVFDMARCNHPDYYPWNFMENLKNGWFCATKYEGGLFQFKPPKIMVLMNQDPPRDKLSKDRYHVVKI